MHAGAASFLHVSIFAHSVQLDVNNCIASQHVDQSCVSDRGQDEAKPLQVAPLQALADPCQRLLPGLDCPSHPSWMPGQRSQSK